ncbi:MAG: TolC family protein [Chloroflexi bacterium]|nr:TolC family protein [Chloroflexota bacterium]
MRFALVVIALLVQVMLAHPVFASEAETKETPGELSLVSLIDRAVSDNSELVVLKKNWEKAKYIAPQLKELPDPEFGLVYSPVPSFANPEYVGQATYVYNISQMIPGGGKLKLMSEVAGHDVLIEYENYREGMREVISQVKLAYYQLLFVNKAISILDRHMDLVRQMIRINRINYTTGKGIQPDLLQADVELSRLKNERITLEEKTRSLKLWLNTLTNQPPENEIGDPAPDQTLPDIAYSRDELKKLALANRPFILAADLSIKKSQTALELAKARDNPDFSLMLSNMYFNRGMMDVEIGVTMSLPFVFHQKYDYSVKEAESQLEAARASYDSTKVMTLQMLNESLIQAEASKRHADFIRDTIIPQSRTLLDSVMANYRTGKLDFNTVITNQQALLNFELEDISSRIERVQALVSAEYAVGQAILPEEKPDADTTIIKKSEVNHDEKK